jgi:thiol-disulfide isomerase/thioredoxin
MIRLLLALSLACGAFSQPAPKPQPEEEELSAALSEIGSSPVEFLRVVEKHVTKYPNSPRRAELERAAVRAAIEVRDERRTILFGERVLARDKDDTQILERVTRALLNSPDKDRAARALKYARHMAEVVHAMRAGAKPEWIEEIDLAEGRALVFAARALSNLGRAEESLPLARQGFEIFPSAEAAREVARSFEKAGKIQEAVVWMANAFTIPDTRSGDADRTRDRVKMGELYRQATGADAGLGDIVLVAYDRMTALMRERKLRSAKADPNANASSPLDFTLPSLDGGKLALASLKGKVVVFDFWATWCGPCRAQHPLYEKVKAQFKGNESVVFLSVNSDEDRSAVKPFLQDVGWKNPVYFEDGLQRALQISSIPTTIVLDKGGQVYSRLNGFVPQRFVEMLTERIRDALGN